MTVLNLHATNNSILVGDGAPMNEILKVEDIDIFYCFGLIFKLFFVSFHEHFMKQIFKITCTRLHELF